MNVRFFRITINGQTFDYDADMPLLDALAHAAKVMGVTVGSIDLEESVTLHDHRSGSLCTPCMDALDEDEAETANEEMANEETLIEWATANGNDAEAVLAYFELQRDVDYTIESFEDAYTGRYDSDEDFAQEMAEDLGLIDANASWPNNCIDWEYAASELMYDYNEENHYYFRSM